MANNEKLKKDKQEVEDGLRRLPEDSIQRIERVIKNNNLTPLEYTVKDNLLFIGTHAQPLFYLIGSVENFQPEKLVIPEGTVMIADYAFKNKKSIRQLVFPSSLEFLGWFTFEGTSIKELFLPEGKLAYDETLIAFDGEIGVGTSLETISLPYNMYQIYKAGQDKGLVETWNRTCKIIYRNPDDSIAEIIGPHPLETQDTNSSKKEVSTHNHDSDEFPF